jgi:mRNA-degrading endonuclease toxin of MazEF toxin-antitoxin module
VARRGDILVAQRRIGFGAKGEPELFVSLQADLLDTLSTVVVAPLDVNHPRYADHPLVVRVAAKGESYAVLVWLLASTLAERFAPKPVGRVPAGTMREIDRVAKTVLDLR